MSSCFVSEFKKMYLLCYLIVLLISVQISNFNLDKINHLRMKIYYSLAKFGFILPI